MTEDIPAPVTNGFEEKAREIVDAWLEAALSPISGITLGNDLVGKITEQEAIDLINETLSARRQVANGTATRGSPDV